MSLYRTIPQLKKTLKNLDRWIDAATEHAKKKSFDPNVLLQARLAPDQYAFVRQVQAACDAAKSAAARLTAKEPPSHPDTEQTIEEVHARIGKVVAYLDGFQEKDFVGAEERHVVLPFLEGKKITGANYVHELALPNFYFHVTHAYAILRHNGVDLGKRDFIGELTLE